MRSVSVQAVLVTIGLAISKIERVAAQVEGDVSGGTTEVVSIRDTDGRLGPLVSTLFILGVVSLVCTVVYWFLTRPKYQIAPTDPTELDFD